MFTYQYAQPKEYHFSLDSIYLAEFVAEQYILRDDLKTLRVLDLCAGCGVVGIELSWYLQNIKQIDFIEIQDLYTPYFNQNVSLVNRPEVQMHWHLLNYELLRESHWHARYDLIISNPPYFLPQHGVLSPSVVKNRCRFFIDSTFENYILAVVNALAPQGHAYILLRSLKQHGFNLFNQVQTLLEPFSISAKKITDIRGTDLILLS